MNRVFAVQLTESYWKMPKGKSINIVMFGCNVAYYDGLEMLKGYFYTVHWTICDWFVDKQTGDKIKGKKPHCCSLVPLVLLS